MFRLSVVAAILSIALINTANAQTDAEKAVKPQPTQMTLDADGNLVGKVFAAVNGEPKPVEAKMTLIREGVKVKSVYADEKGVFSFGSVQPGTYAVSGAAASYVGVQPVVVTPAAATPAPAAPAQNSMVLSSPSYSSFAGAPAASCGGGCASGGGFLSGGGGRLLGNRRLLRLGLIGGVVAIAVSGDDEDVSPEN